MLWEYVYIGSELVRSSMVGLCLMLGLSLTSSTKKSRGHTSLTLAELVRSFKRYRSTISGSYKKKDKRKRSTVVEKAKGLGTLLALEPRIMFDGAALTTGAEVIQDQVTQDLLSTDQSPVGSGTEGQTFPDPFTDSVDLLSALSSVTAPSDRQDIVFIDTSVEDYQILLRGIDPNAEVVLLNSTRDGVEQIAEILGDRSNIDAIHIISHGNQGELYVGNSVLNLASMQGEYADELATINQALNDEADWLIYGCNFGEGIEGKKAALLLAKLTGSDIAASDDLTGRTIAGGDWDLEVQTGIIESTVIVNKQVQQEWSGLLATFNVTNTNDSGAGSLRQAIIDSNASAGTTDTINLPSGTYTLLGASGEDAAASGDLDITDDVIIVGAGAATTIIDGNNNDRVFHIRNSASAVISGITIQDGVPTGSGGAGVRIENSSTLSLSDAILTNNNGTGGDGGGFHVHGTLNLDRVLLNNNVADAGAGIYFHGADGGSLTNVTISGNTSSGNGGGLWTDTAISIKNSTITLNTGTNGGGIFANGTTVTISNTIVSDNTATSSNDDVLGTFSSDGFNLIQTVGGASGFSNDLTGSSANLDVLADNGGTTQTHALLAGSLAINAGANQSAPSIDGRNIARNEIPDIGAYESTTAASKVYWTESGSNGIFRSNTDGSAKQEILSGLGSPTGLDVDVTGGKIYWIESATTSLHRANLDGSNVENLDTTNLVNPQGIGLDLVNSHIFVADDGNGVDDAIRRFNLDGTGFTTIVSSLNGVIRDVAADPIGNKLYFTEFGGGIFDGEIKSTDIGGGAIADVVTGQAGPTSLVLDIASDKMYWTDDAQTPGFDNIKRADLDGSNDQVLTTTGLQDPSGIAIDVADDKLYWSDQTANFVRRSDIAGTNQLDIATGLNSPREIAAIRVGADNVPTLDLDANDSSGATGNAYQFTFSENDAPTAIADSDTDLVDADSTTFASVTLTLTGLLDGDAETLVLDGDTFALATAVAGQDTTGGNYRVAISTAASTASITITKQGGGTFTEIETETLIEAIQYQHTDTNNPTEGNRLINVIVNDGTSDSVAARSTINVDPVNDPPVPVANSFTVDEGSTNTLNLAGNDSDPDDGLDLTSIAIIAGPINGTIDSINSDGTVSYTHDGSETIADSFTYTINDIAGATSNTATVSLTITPQNDAPIITSDGGGASTTVRIITDNTRVTDVTATDAESTPVTYSITGGADAALFTIDTMTGVLTFLTAPDIQAPGDVGGDNVYDVIVQASDGTLTDTQAIAITVADVPFVVLPPTSDSPSESPSDNGEEDSGDSADETAGNVLNIETNSNGNFSSGNQSAVGNDPKDSTQLHNLAENDLALMEHLRDGTPVNGGATGNLMDLLQRSFGTTTLKSEMHSLLGSSSGFLKDLDQARDALNDITATEKTYVASSIAASTGLSVGYVFWLLRSGVLLTALLSSVPAWQFVNPLLVLDTPTKKKRLKGQEDLEDDSVESMFENQAMPDETSETKTPSHLQADQSRQTQRTER